MCLTTTMATLAQLLAPLLSIIFILPGIIRINQMQVYPQRKEIVVTMPGIRDVMEPMGAFVGVWSIDDNGDVPPRLKIPADDRTKLKKPFGVVLDPKHKEVIVSDMRNQGILTFSVPEIF